MRKKALDVFPWHVGMQTCFLLLISEGQKRSSAWLRSKHHYIYEIRFGKRPWPPAACDAWQTGMYKTGLNRLPFLLYERTIALLPRRPKQKKNQRCLMAIVFGMHVCAMLSARPQSVASVARQAARRIIKTRNIMSSFFSNTLVHMSPQ